MIHWWQTLGWQGALLIASLPIGILCLAATLLPKRPDVLDPPSPSTRRGTVEAAGKVWR